MITFQDVKKSYGSYIFDVSSLHIPQGIITGLVGKMEQEKLQQLR